MTSEMAFECVLVSSDPAVLRTMDPLLHGFSIQTRICPNPLTIDRVLDQCAADLIVIDLESANYAGVLHRLREDRAKQKPTVLAVSVTDGAVPGVHVLLRKPVTADSGLKSLTTAYSRMLRDFRAHTRFALMKSVLASDENGRTLPLTVTNIGVGGIGVTTKEKLAIGSSLSFRLVLPELDNAISIRARVLWIRQYGVAGCEFVHIPAFDTQLLQAWLESRYRIKKPLITI
ncbi:MAG TPA: PilZ domain-containing protein [Candidatus Sulfotelmatobacter sp.]|nr:PilZ domain-containing protein [Candidatus Sulfotelmatobacter sp.]